MWIVSFAFFIYLYHFMFALITEHGELCNRSATSKLTMENVPWHSDVKEFSEALAQKSNGVYEVACEHVHSCCVLLANVNKFKVNDQWFTWIDYDKFHDLVGDFVSFFSFLMRRGIIGLFVHFLLNLHILN